MPPQELQKQINEILDGKRNLSRFTQAEHAGLCSAGPILIGALLVCDHARESLSSGLNASGGQTKIPNWQIDEVQERSLQSWAEKTGVWVPDAETILTDSFGQMIAQGAESKVFYKTGDTHVVKLRTSIYATLGRAIDSIALHNYFFPETIMRVVGFTRDTDGLFRTVLTQPYIECQRLADKTEIDSLLCSKGFQNNCDGTGVNYESDRYILEDMHPANVFVEPQTQRPICIDCIVKFRR